VPPGLLAVMGWRAVVEHRPPMAPPMESVKMSEDHDKTTTRAPVGKPRASDGDNICTLEARCPCFAPCLVWLTICATSEGRVPPTICK
jgi:hypothetical protein